ncbi:competence protein CoiA family protein [Bifidobacterium leontopitheci]|uniref:Uncharacterized protein n=1 Tax=Bifidobacterium leontopitheci TaxID=2650774 RepID=A0A6I1GND2_9BIFI|nr:hypothetical protein [Bifidobacterium leontopitheci]KAB7789558.1 hypothetical protein F7D09_1931 [Bifidobacterium leontopitheci]
MDRAIQVVNMALAVQVTAEDANGRFHGEIPSSVRFYCPYCTRPVIARATGRQFDRKRARHIQRTVRPHFSHRSNDEWARLCDEYHAGNGAYDTDDLPLLMFLRRETITSRGTTSRFRIDIALRRRGLSSLLQEMPADESITVDGKPYRMRDLLAARRHTIPLSDPLHDLESRIQIPQQWQANVGMPQNSHGILFFSDTFGGNGGRRLPNHSALYCDCTYYLVMREARVAAARPWFDRMEQVGCISGAAHLGVYAVSIASDSKRKNSIDEWLAQYGYCLSDIDRNAQLMWPPSIRSWGVDEPLFRHSSPIYRFPYLSGNGPMPDTMVRRRLLPDDARTRDVGFIGFGSDPVITKESQSYCVFFKAQSSMPWSTVYLGPRYPEDLHPYDAAAEEGDVTPSENEPPDKQTSPQTSPQTPPPLPPYAPLPTGVDIALRRMERPQHPRPVDVPYSVIVAQYREGAC